MFRKLRITVEGRTYDVTVEDVTDHGGTLYPPPGLTQEAARAAPPRAAAPAVPAAPVTPAAMAHMTPNDKLSPLAGVIAAVEIEEGAQVEEGQRMVVIEAMKMKTPVTAHRSGRVTRVAVKAGQAVDAGQVLLTIS